MAKEIDIPCTPAVLSYTGLVGRENVVLQSDFSLDLIKPILDYTILCFDGLYGFLKLTYTNSSEAIATGWVVILTFTESNAKIHCARRPP